MTQTYIGLRTARGLEKMRVSLPIHDSSRRGQYVSKKIYFSKRWQMYRLIQIGAQGEGFSRSGFPDVSRDDVKV